MILKEGKNLCTYRVCGIHTQMKLERTITILTRQRTALFDCIFFLFPAEALEYWNTAARLHL